MPIKKTAKKRELTAPRGMRDIIGNEFYAYVGFFEKASEIALYYGFTPIQTPILEKEEVFTSSVGVNTDIVEKEMYTLRVRGGEKLAIRPEGTAGVMRAYIEKGMHTYPQPVMLYYYGPFLRHDKPQRGRFREFFQFGLEVIGTQKGIADAMIIHATHVILTEVGLRNLCIVLNSIGDKECRSIYIRDLAVHYRKYINQICANCRERLKSNPLRVLDCKDPKCQPIKKEAPEMTNYLCSGCKEHFKEVLEHLEALHIPYKIDHALVRGIDYYTRTVFEIISEEIPKMPAEKTQPADAPAPEGNTFPENPGEEAPLALSFASGGRYDVLAKCLGSKKDVPAVGVAIGVDRVIGALASPSSLAPRIVKKPKIYFIQIGFEGKLKSLSVVEILRKAKIPITHSLNKDKLSAQLASAEKMSIPYVIIVGQKEALENSVIVRNMVTRSQDTISMEKLADYLKKKI